MSTGGKTNHAITFRHVFLAGDDEFRIKQDAAQTAASMAPDDEFNLETIDGQVEYVERACEQIVSCIEALLTLPFFGGRKLVFFKNCSFLGDGAIGKSEQVLSTLEKLASTLAKTAPSEATLVMSALSIDKRRSFYKNIGKLAEVRLHEQIDLSRSGGEQQWRKLFSAELKNRGLDASPGVAELMMDMVGSDTRALINEMDKLDLYCGDRRHVEESDVLQIVSSTRDRVVWDLCDAVSTGDRSAAVHLAHALFAQGSSPFEIVSILSNHFRIAASALHSHERGWIHLKKRGFFTEAVISTQAADLLPKSKTGAPASPFRVGKILQQMKAVPSSTAFGMIETIYKTYFQILSTGTNGQQAVESCIVNLSGAAKR